MGLDQWMSAEQASSVFPPTGVRRIRGPGSLLFRQGLQRMHPIPALCLRFTGGLRQQNLEETGYHVMAGSAECILLLGEREGEVLFNSPSPACDRPQQWIKPALISAEDDRICRNCLAEYM